jgi:hypothetical protein
MYGVMEVILLENSGWLYLHCSVALLVHFPFSFSNFFKLVAAVKTEPETLSILNLHDNQ